MGMRLAMAFLACALGAFAGVYHWTSERHGAYETSPRRAQTLGIQAAPQSAPLTESSRMRLVAARPVQFAAASTSAEAFYRLAAISLVSPVDTVAIGDVTGDGRNDVIASTHHIQAGAVSPSDYKVSVFVQQADGRLAPPLQASFPGFTMHSENKGFALVDLNEDGFRDIVLGYGEGLYIFEGAASGQLFGRDVPNVSGSVKAVVALDINHDDHADLVTFDDFRMRVYLGDGHGMLQNTFTVSTYPVEVSNLKSHMAPGDLNGDGRMDLAFFNGFNQGAVFEQTESGTFVRRVYVLNPYPEAVFSAMAVADFDSDGDHDLMFATHATDRNHPTAKHYLYRQSGGQLIAPVQWGAYAIASAMIGADMDRDGREDLLTVRTANDVLASVGYSRQMPDGSYDTEVRFPLTAALYSTNPRGIAAGDFTGDGCSDIAAVSGASLVLLQAACVPLRVMSGPLPPRLGQSPTAASSSPVSAQTIVPIDDMTLVRPARRSAKPIAEPRPGVPRAVRQTSRPSNHP